MKKAIAIIALLSIFYSASSQTVTFADGCWDQNNGKYKFSFTETGNPTDVVTYSTNFDSTTRVLATKDVNGVYNVIVNKANNSPSQRRIILVYVNGHYVAQKHDSTNTCPYSLPLRYKEGSFELVGKPKQEEIIELNHK
jgi:hypothetical protein